MGFNPLRRIKQLLNSKKLFVRIATACFIFWVLKQLFRMNNIEGMCQNGGDVLKYFYMDGCPHCVKFNDTWKEFKNTDVGKRCNMPEPIESASMSETDKKLVQGFPTIILFDKNGNEKARLPDGARTVEGLKKLANTP
uniref:Thioredoxin domain-containing protein n=1 Tax=uncultured marine group II/III euryarchaeote AD1000_88_G11 TaxID=1457822 RepID=A0A075G060_9EURY|nr:hypothetical protein [uncultured marine group II/III euryarchaeote AD1000_88_G11]